MCILSTDEKAEDSLIWGTMNLKIELKDPKYCDNNCPYLKYVECESVCTKYRKFLNYIDIGYIDAETVIKRPDQCIKENGE